MVAAASAAIVQFYPGSGDEVLALAATSNLLSSMLGIFVAIYVALPISERLYRALSRDKAGEWQDGAAKEKPKTPAPKSGPVVAAMPKWRVLVMVAVALLQSASSPMAATDSAKRLRCVRKPRHCASIIEVFITLLPVRGHPRPAWAPLL